MLFLAMIGTAALTAGGVIAAQQFLNPSQTAPLDKPQAAKPPPTVPAKAPAPFGVEQEPETQNPTAQPEKSPEPEKQPTARPTRNNGRTKTKRRPREELARNKPAETKPEPSRPAFQVERTADGVRSAAQRLLRRAKSLSKSLPTKKKELASIQVAISQEMSQPDSDKAATALERLSRKLDQIERGG
jgi:hypothetical protein